MNKLGDPVIWNEHASDAGWFLETTASNGVAVINTWITKRPPYCDRGHYSVGVAGNLESGLDEQDGFPRYFMDLDIAKRETEAWLVWRLFKKP